MKGNQRYETQNYNNNRRGNFKKQNYENRSRSYDRQIEAITEGTIEGSVIVGLGEVQEKVQIEIELDVLSAENMIILQ